MITYEDFQKLDMRIGKVISAEPVPDSDKLIRFMLDFGIKTAPAEAVPPNSIEKNSLGEERDIRQILSAIREYYPETETLVGKSMLFVTNLEPRTIRGFESQGMLMAVGEDRPIFLIPEESVAPGAKVR